jgi:hypothetical protein
MVVQPSLNLADSEKGRIIGRRPGGNALGSERRGAASAEAPSTIDFLIDIRCMRSRYEHMHLLSEAAVPTP